MENNTKHCAAAVAQIHGGIARLNKRAMVHIKYIPEAGAVLTRLEKLGEEASALGSLLADAGKLHQAGVEMQQVAAMKRKAAKEKETGKEPGTSSTKAASGTVSTAKPTEPIKNDKTAKA